MFPSTTYITVPTRIAINAKCPTTMVEDSTESVFSDEVQHLFNTANDQVCPEGDRLDRASFRAGEQQQQQQIPRIFRLADSAMAIRAIPIVGKLDDEDRERRNYEVPPGAPETIAA
jgi:hypothetical protein